MWAALPVRERINYDDSYALEDSWQERTGDNFDSDPSENDLTYSDAIDGASRDEIRIIVAELIDHKRRRVKKANHPGRDNHLD